VILEEIDEELAALLDDDDLEPKKGKKKTSQNAQEEVKNHDNSLLNPKNSKISCKNLTINSNVNIPISK